MDGQDSGDTVEPESRDYDQPTPPALDSSGDATSGWYFVPLPNADFLNQQLASSQSAFIPVPGPLDETCAINPSPSTTRILVRMPDLQPGESGGVITLVQQPKEGLEMDTAEDVRRFDLVNRQFDKLERVLANATLTNVRTNDRRNLNKYRVLNKAVDSIQQLRTQLQRAHKEIARLKLENDHLRQLLTRPESAFPSPMSLTDELRFTPISINNIGAGSPINQSIMQPVIAMSPSNTCFSPAMALVIGQQFPSPSYSSHSQAVSQGSASEVVFVSEDETEAGERRGDTGQSHAQAAVPPVVNEAVADATDTTQQSIPSPVIRQDRAIRCPTVELSDHEEEEDDDAALVRAIDDVIYSQGFWT